MSDLDGATEPGYRGAYPATPGEFAARWNSHTEVERQDLLDRLNATQEASIRELTHI